MEWMLVFLRHQHLTHKDLGYISEGTRTTFSTLVMSLDPRRNTVIVWITKQLYAYHWNLKTDLRNWKFLDPVDWRRAPCEGGGCLHRGATGSSARTSGQNPRLTTSGRNVRRLFADDWHDNKRCDPGSPPACPQEGRAHPPQHQPRHIGEHLHRWHWHVGKAASSSSP